MLYWNGKILVVIVLSAFPPRTDGNELNVYYVLRFYALTLLPNKTKKQRNNKQINNNSKK